jgi:protein tyrosine/serine phosphatase
MVRKFVNTYALALLTILTLTFAASAQQTPDKPFSNVKIGNFGQMDDNFYRGAQPLPEDYKSLADIGIKTIIDLRNDPTDYEKAAAEAVGITYVNIPMSGWKTPKDSDVAKFMKLATDPATGKFFVHCKAGIHRTGVVGAVYRMEKYGWDYDQSYREMKNYNFSTGLVHGALKSYVKDYAERIDSEKAVAAASTAAAQSN